MKTSNILISSFIALTVIVTVFLGVRMTRQIKEEMSKSKTDNTEQSQMTYTRFENASSLSIDGNNSLRVVVKNDKPDSSGIWIDPKSKDLVNVNLKNSLLSISCESKLDKRILVIVTMPSIDTLMVNDSRCRVQNFSGKDLLVGLKGNSSLAFKDCSYSFVQLFLSDNSRAGLDNIRIGNLKVEAKDNGVVYGVSTSIKIDMKTSDNGKIVFVGNSSKE